MFINSQKIKKPQQSITSNLQIEKRTSNNIYNSTLKTQDYNNKLSARTTHKEEEENTEFTSINQSPVRKKHLFIKSNDNSKSKSKDKEKLLSKAKSIEYSTPEIQKQINSQNSVSFTKSLLLLKKGKGSPEASIIDERNHYQSTVSFENKIKDKAKVAFDLKNPLREKKGSVLFNFSNENSTSRKNSSILKKKF